MQRHLLFAWRCNSFFDAPSNRNVNPRVKRGFGDGQPQPWASLVAQTGKNLPAVQETWVLSLGQEDPLEKGMAIHSNILAWEIPWTEEPDGLQSMGSQRVRHDLTAKQQQHSY